MADILLSTLHHIFVHETIRQDFVGTKFFEAVAQLLLHVTQFVFCSWLHAAKRQFTWQFIKAIKPANFFDDVFRQLDIGAPKWCRE